MFSECLTEAGVELEERSGRSPVMVWKGRVCEICVELVSCSISMQLDGDYVLNVGHLHVISGVS